MLGDLPACKFWPDIGASAVATVWVSTRSHICPQFANSSRKSPLLVVEVCSVAIVAKTIWCITCFATVQVRTVWRSQAPNAAAAAILHKIRLAKYKSDLILVCGPKVWQMKIWYCCAVGVAAVPHGR